MTKKETEKKKKNIISNMLNLTWYQI